MCALHKVVSPIIACMIVLILCLCPPPSFSQDILHQMYEQGAQYSQKDYINAFKLLAHSQPSYDGDRLTACIQAVEMFFSKGILHPVRYQTD